MQLDDRWIPAQALRLRVKQMSEVDMERAAADVSEAWPDCPLGALFRAWARRADPPACFAQIVSGLGQLKLVAARSAELDNIENDFLGAAFGCLNEAKGRTSGLDADAIVKAASQENLASLYVVAAAVLGASGRHRDALDFADRAERRAGPAPGPHLRRFIMDIRTDAYVGLGDRDTAIGLLRRALAESGERWLQTLLAKALSSAGRWEELVAEVHPEARDESTDDTQQALECVVTAYVRLGRRDEALAAIEKMSGSKHEGLRAWARALPVLRER